MAHGTRSDAGRGTRPQRAGARRARSARPPRAGRAVRAAARALPCALLPRLRCRAPGHLALVGALLCAAAACGSAGPRLEAERLEASARPEAFRWSDTGPAPAFAADRSACARELRADAFLARQPALNQALMLRGCLEKRGWRHAPGAPPPPARRG